MPGQDFKMPLKQACMTLRTLRPGESLLLADGHYPGKSDQYIYPRHVERSEAILQPVNP
jgi:hypothetical protein